MNQGLLNVNFELDRIERISLEKTPDADLDKDWSKTINEYIADMSQTDIRRLFPYLGESDVKATVRATFDFSTLEKNDKGKDRPSVRLIYFDKKPWPVKL